MLPRRLRICTKLVDVVDQLADVRGAKPTALFRLPMLAANAHKLSFLKGMGRRVQVLPVTDNPSLRIFNRLRNPDPLSMMPAVSVNDGQQAPQ